MTMIFEREILFRMFIKHSTFVKRYYNALIEIEIYYWKRYSYLIRHRILQRKWNVNRLISIQRMANFRKDDNLDMQSFLPLYLPFSIITSIHLNFYALKPWNREIAREIIRKPGTILCSLDIISRDRRTKEEFVFFYVWKKFNT